MTPAEITALAERLDDLELVCDAAAGMAQDRARSETYDTLRLGFAGAATTLRALLAEREAMRGAMIEACDLLAERRCGNPARSPGHNARLCLESFLAALTPPAPALKEGEKPTSPAVRVTANVIKHTATIKQTSGAVFPPPSPDREQG